DADSLELGRDVNGTLQPAPRTAGGAHHDEVEGASIALADPLPVARSPTRRGKQAVRKVRIVRNRLGKVAPLKLPPAQGSAENGRIPRVVENLGQLTAVDGECERPAHLRFPNQRGV